MTVSRRVVGLVARIVGVEAGVGDSVGVGSGDVVESGDVDGVG